MEKPSGSNLATPTDAEAVLLAVLDLVRSAVLLTDDKNAIVEANRAAREFTGRSRDDLVGRPLDEVVDAPDHAEATRRAERGADAPVDAALLRADGSRLRCACRVRPGIAPGLHLTVLDRLTAPAGAAATTERRMAAIGDASPVLIWMTGPDGACTFLDDAWLELTDRPLDEQLGDGWLEAVHPDDADRRAEVFREALAARRGFSFEFRLRSGDGQYRWVLDAARPRWGENDTFLGFVGSCVDISARKRFEAIAEVVNSMDHVGYIVSGIRHELGNPINSVKTVLAVLRNGLRTYTPELVENYLERSLAEIGRVEYLLRSLKTFGMHENPKPEPVEVGRLVRRFGSLVRGDFAARDIMVIVEVAEPDLWALVDTRALHQVLLNLVANAADALDARPDPEIRLRAERSGERVSITITDNGVGMSETQRALLFKPFYTSKPSGTGLGLVISRRLTAQMGGTLQISSRAGAGTSARLTFERADADG